MTADRPTDRPSVIAHTEQVSFSPLPVGSMDRCTWQVTVDYAAGFDGDRWAVRIMGRALNKHTRQWDPEPIPSSRTDEWLADHRWTDYGEAVTAARAVCGNVTWNGMSADFLARRLAAQPAAGPTGA